MAFKRKATNQGAGSQAKKQKRPVAAAVPPVAADVPDNLGPSNNWETATQSNWKKLAIEEIIKTAKWPYLFPEAAKHHPSGQQLTCDFTKWTAGGFNAVFELAFPDGTFWIARIRMTPEEADEVGDPETDMASEVATMRLVGSRTTIPVPEVFTYDHREDGDNPFDYPFMLMSALPGASPKRQLRKIIPAQHKAKVAAQLASVYYQLSTITFPQSGSIFAGFGLDEPYSTIRLCNIPNLVEIGPFNSSLADLSAVRRRYNDEIRDGVWGDEPYEDWKPICNAFTGIIGTALISSAHRRGPFPLWHSDLHPGNMLFDFQWNLTGILDWTGARAAPVENFIAFREICMRDGHDEDWIEEFKDMFVAEFARLENANGGGLGLTPLFASRLPQAMHHWLTGNFMAVLDEVIEEVEDMLQIVYGEDATVENWKKLEKQGLGKGFRAEFAGKSKYAETRVTKPRKRRA